MTASGATLANVAEELDRRVLGEHAADAIAQPGQVLTGDRSVHGERDGLCHRLIDGAAGECSSTPMSFKNEDGLLLR